MEKLYHLGYDFKGSAGLIGTIVFRENGYVYIREHYTGKMYMGIASYLTELI